MDVHAFLKSQNIGICVILEPENRRYVMYRNESEQSASFELFKQLVLVTGFDGLCGYMEGQELLPRMMGQGDAQCIMFPDPDGNIVCLFFQDSGDPVKCFHRCRQMMQDYLEAAENAT